MTPADMPHKCPKCETHYAQPQSCDWCPGEVTHPIPRTAMPLSADVWMGLSKTGERRQISHADLMQWAYRNEQQFTVGWSHHYTDPNGTRLVRGDHVREARMQGWDDLADMLEEHFAENGA